MTQMNLVEDSGDSGGQRSLMCCSSWGGKEPDMTGSYQYPVISHTGKEYEKECVYVCVCVCVCV